jgi:hypothetical protein
MTAHLSFLQAPKRRNTSTLCCPEKKNNPAKHTHARTHAPPTPTPTPTTHTQTHKKKQQFSNDVEF